MALNKRNTDTFKQKKEKIHYIIHSTPFAERINKCKNSSLQNKVLLIPLQKKNLTLTLFLAKMANMYDKIQKKRNFGI